MRADVFVTIYPYFCTSLSSKEPMYLWDASFIKFLANIRSRYTSVLYIIDLPLEQSRINTDVKCSLCRMEGSIFKSFDKLCVFNEKMKDKIRELYDIPEDRFIEFEILDYGIEFNGTKSDANLNGRWTIVLAGNLERQYLGNWITDLVPDKNITYVFFGRNGQWISEIGRSNIIYNGTLPSAELLAKYISANAHFGIIYYDRGETDDYFEYGSTSKFSAYLAAGLPILVHQKHRYINHLTRKYDIGLLFGDISEISDILESLSSNRYLELRRNALKLGNKIRTGYFYKTAINEALSSF